MKLKTSSDQPHDRKTEKASFSRLKASFLRLRENNIKKKGVNELNNNKKDTVRQQKTFNSQTWAT